jgi:hypothetical protein
MVGIPVASAPLRRWPYRLSRRFLVVAVAGLAALLWYGSRPSLEAAISEFDLHPFDGVRLDSESWVAVRPIGAFGVEAIYVDDNFTSGWSAGRSATTGEAADDGATIGMFGGGGEDTLGWSTFLYGIGPPGTSDIAVAGHRAVGFVMDPPTGAFVVASREELNPDELHYFLLDADGDVIFDGTGLSATDLH